MHQLHDSLNRKSPQCRCTFTHVCIYHINFIWIITESIKIQSWSNYGCSFWLQPYPTYAIKVVLNFVVRFCKLTWLLLCAPFAVCLSGYMQYVAFFLIFMVISLNRYVESEENSLKQLNSLFTIELPRKLNCADVSITFKLHSVVHLVCHVYRLQESKSIYNEMALA